MTELCIQMGFRWENMVKNAKKDTFWIILAPQGVCSKVSNFSNVIFLLIQVCVNVISHKMHQLYTRCYSVGAQSPIYGYFSPPAVQTSLSNFFPRGEPSTNGIF